MKMIEVTQLVDDPSADFVFEVELLDGHKYKVTLSKDYYQKLTRRMIGADELVEKSFEFLLEKEPPSAVLPEFELPLINHYFPEYENTIRKRLNA
jgi:hypothetical protein